MVRVRVRVRQLLYITKSNLDSAERMQYFAMIRKNEAEYKNRDRQYFYRVLWYPSDFVRRNGQLVEQSKGLIYYFVSNKIRLVRLQNDVFDCCFILNTAHYNI